MNDNNVLGRSELAYNRLVDDLAREIRAEIKGRCLIDEPLSNHTSFRVGGPARLYVLPASAQDLSALLQLCSDRKLNAFIIGYGTNLLVSDDGYTGCVIDLAEGFRVLDVKGDKMTVGAGVWMNDAVRFSAEQGLDGLTRSAGIPGGLGGHCKMNAGAFGASISDHLVDLDVMDLNGNIRTMTKDEVGFIYRGAPNLAGKVVLEGRFQLQHGKRAEILSAVEETITERYRRRVIELPSAGSVFKNPTENARKPGDVHKLFAAKMLESVGAKGLSVGGVEVSSEHANFIINTRSGTASDIVALIRKLRGMVSDRFGIKLDLELRTVGFDEEV